MTTDRKIADIVNVIVENVHPLKVILFGSYARGTPSPNSDVDLMIVKEWSQPRRQREVGLRRRLRGCKVPMDLLFYTPQEIEEWRHVSTSFVSRVMREGKLLYG